MQITMGEVSHFLTGRQHAIVWAMNFRERTAGPMPTAMQIVNGVQADLKRKISYRTAERALQTIRKRDLPQRGA